MTRPSSKNRHCAIYTRKSSEEGLEQAFNSLDAQREACEAYIKSQRHEGWKALPRHYDDGGFSGGNTERPGLKQLLDDIKAGNVDVIVVYKVDRLSRSLADFVRLIELFDKHDVSFVSVTQQFNTSSSMGRLTLNVLLSFAQFEREVTGERIRDKIAASRQKGMWMGGVVPLGYDVMDKTLLVNEQEAKTVRHIYTRYLALGCVRQLKEELDTEGYVSKVRAVEGVHTGGRPFSRGALYTLLKNPIYIGQVTHQGRRYEGQHAGILEHSLWEKVQARLHENRRKHKTRKSVKDPSLLAGLLFDESGHLLSPSHTRKQNQRYRYYVNQTVLHDREQDSGSILRLPAKVIENLVVQQLLSLWKNTGQLLGLLNRKSLSANRQASLLSRAKSLLSEWAAFTPHQQISYLKMIFQKIIIRCEGVDLHISSNGMLACLSNATLTEEILGKEVDTQVVTVPAKLKRCGIETRFIVKNDTGQGPHAISVKAMQDALVKALRWHEELVSGTIESTADIAKSEGITQRYIVRILKLAFLAPDIMEAIIAGCLPGDLTLTRLKKGFPMEWDQQRKVLSFTPH